MISGFNSRKILFLSIAVIGAIWWVLGSAALADTPIETPPSLVYGLSDDLNSGEINLPPVDIDKLMAEDQRRNGPGVPYRIGICRNLPDVMFQSGSLTKLNKDGYVWRLRISSEGAYSLRIHITNFNLPPGEKLYIHAPQSVSYVYTGKGPFNKGSFWSWSSDGDVADIEWFIPASENRQPASLPFSINSVAHTYRDFLEEMAMRSDPKEGTCHNDVNCFSAWSEQRDASAHIRFIDGAYQYMCSGTMLNNTSQDCTPYFMTANHCISSDSVANTLEAYFFYNSSYCNSGSGSLGASRNGASMLSHNSTSDYSLLLLDTTNVSGIYFAGWDRNTLAYNEDVTCIHHPDGAYKRISFGTRETALYGTNFWGVHWDRTSNPGVTEGGSSGSGLFRDSNHLFVGQLYGGESSCSNQDGIDDYGKFSISYNDGLATWLGTATTLDGMYCNASSTPTPTPTSTTVPPTSTPTPGCGETDLFVMDNDCSAATSNFAGACDPASMDMYVGTDMCPTDCSPSDDCHIGWSWDSGDSGIHWQYFITPVLTLDCTKNILFDMCYGFDGYDTNLQGDFYVYWRCADGGATTDCSTMTDSGVSGDWQLAWSDTGVDWTTNCSSRTVTHQEAVLPCTCHSVEVMIAINFDAYADQYGFGYFRVYYDSCDVQCSFGERNCPDETPTPAPPTNTPIPTNTPVPPTSTPIPPTATPTSVPSTQTPAPPTHTPTPNPPTNTPTGTPPVVPTIGGPGLTGILLVFTILLGFAFRRRRYRLNR